MTINTINITLFISIGLSLPTVGLGQAQLIDYSN